MKNVLLYFPKLTGPLRAFYNYFFGEPEISFIAKEIKSKSFKYLFYDIGANYGVYTFFFGKKANKIYVFEPIKECVEYIKSGYSKDNIVFINKIASDSTAIKELKVPIINKRKIFGKASIVNNFSNFESRDIESVTIDSYANQMNEISNELLHVIKIDVEGYENAVLKGALNLLSKQKVLLIIEIEQRHNKDYIETFEKMVDLNYGLYYLKDKEIKKIDSLNEIEKIMSYQNNFIFKNY